MSNITTIARVYSPSQAGLIISALESCDITVLTHDFHTSVTVSNMTQAIGGMRISVPTPEAEEAYDILATLGPYEPPMLPVWVYPLLVIGWLFSNVAPPASGVFPTRGVMQPVQDHT